MRFPGFYDLSFVGHGLICLDADVLSVKRKCVRVFFINFEEENEWNVKTKLHINYGLDVEKIKCQRKEGIRYTTHW